jgi:hypothetical protein
VHRFRAVFASGWIPARNHFAYLAYLQMPAAMKTIFRERPLADGEVAIQLIRLISWTTDSVSIADRITGEIAGKKLMVGTRFLDTCKTQVNGLTIGERLRGWSSDGLQQMQLYSTLCSGTECRYEIILQA